MNPTPDTTQPSLLPEDEAQSPSGLLSRNGSLVGETVTLSRKHLTLLRKIPGLSSLVAFLEARGKIHRSALTLTILADHAPTVIAVPRTKKRLRYYFQTSLRLEADLVTPVPDP